MVCPIPSLPHLLIPGISLCRSSIVVNDIVIRGSLICWVGLPLILQWNYFVYPMCRGVETATSMLFESVSEYGSPVAQVDSRTQESRKGDAMVYPSSAQFGPYIQQLMILILKSTQN